MFRYEKVKNTTLDIFSATAYCCQYAMLHMVNGKRSLRKKQLFKTAMFLDKILILLGRIYYNITWFDGSINRMFLPLSPPMSGGKRGTHRNTSKNIGENQANKPHPQLRRPRDSHPGYIFRNHCSHHCTIQYLQYN